MTYDEINNLKNKILNEEITVADAKALYFDSINKRSWHTEDWRERRKNIIKDKCEICGSDDTLTLQHISHPKNYSEHRKEIVSRYMWKKRADIINVEQEFISYIESNYVYYPINLCPRCGSRHPNSRMRKKPQYLCTQCKFEFEEPVKKPINEIFRAFISGEDSIEIHDKCFVSKGEYKSPQNIKQLDNWLIRQKIYAKYKDEIEKETFLSYLDDNIKYLSFEDAKTYCKKCAFNFDIKNKDLCPICKKRYKERHYPTCVECLPEDKRKEVLDKIESGKAWKEMHVLLDILPGLE